MGKEMDLLFSTQWHSHVCKIIHINSLTYRAFNTYNNISYWNITYCQKCGQYLLKEMNIGTEAWTSHFPSSLLLVFGFLLLLLLGWIALRLRLALLGRAGLRLGRPVRRPFLLGFLVMFLFGLSFVCYRFVRRGRLVSCWLQNRLRPLFTLFSFWEKTFFLFLHLLLLGVLVRFGLFNFGFPVRVNVNTKVNKLA